MSNAQIKITLKDIFYSEGPLKIKILKAVDLLIGAGWAWILEPKEKNRRLPTKIKKILIIRPGGIGDAIFLIPIIKKLKAERPALEIDILCERRNCEVFLLLQSQLRQIYCYDEFNELFEVFRNAYDVVVDSEQWHHFSGICSYYATASYTIGFATRPVRAKFYDAAIDYQRDGYELDNFSELFSSLLFERPFTEQIDGCLTLDADVSRWAEVRVPRESIAIFLGASIAIRRLNFQQIEKIIFYVIEQNRHVILLGGSDVLNVGLDLEKKFPTNKLSSFVGKTTLKESAALIQKTSLFIGPDSGLLHLACSIGTPVIAIFGPGNIKKWQPKSNRHFLVTEDLECAPCTRFGYTIPTCHGRFDCMKNISGEKIIKHINIKESV